MNYICFWCYKPLDKKECTKDHFLSKPLWNVIQHQRPDLPDRSPKCVSCGNCNSRRGAISSLFTELRRLKKRFHGRRYKSFIKCKKRLLPEILSFRKKIVSSVQNLTIKTLCLRELDEILAYVPSTERKHVEVRAYYLWEAAGRPYGQQDEFWFEAERQIRHELYNL